jgi:AcrR family transcriptional regulator
MTPGDARGESSIERFLEGRRARILEAMAQETVEKGFAAVEVGDVVTRAGLKREEFDDLFDSLEECLLIALDALLSEVMAAVGRSYSLDKAELESVGDGIAALLELFAAQPSYTALAFTEAEGATDRTQEIFDAGQRTLASFLERSWAYAPTATRQSSDAARAIMGGATTVVRGEVLAGRTELLRDLTEDLVYCGLVGFIGVERAREQARAAAERHR